MCRCFFSYEAVDISWAMRPQPARVGGPKRKPDSLPNHVEPREFSTCFCKGNRIFHLYDWWGEKPSESSGMYILY